MSPSVCKGIVAILLSGWAAFASAVPLPPDGTPVVLPGTNWRSQPGLAGKVVADRVTPFSYLVIDDNCGEQCTYQYNIVGTLHSQVVRAADRSYDFYWSIATQPVRTRILSGVNGEVVQPVPAGFAADVSSATLAGLAGSNFRVDWRNDTAAGAAAPRTAVAGKGSATFYFSERFFDDGGSQVGIQNSTLQTGGSSRSFFLDTNAHAFSSHATMQIATSNREPFTGPSGGYFSVDEPRLVTFGPSPVPEPSTWAMMLVGLAGVGFAARRNAKR